MGSNPTLSASKIKASGAFARKPFSVLFLFLTAWLLRRIVFFPLECFEQWDV